MGRPFQDRFEPERLRDSGAAVNRVRWPAGVRGMTGKRRSGVRRPHNPLVAGSNPAGPTNPPLPKPLANLRRSLRSESTCRVPVALGPVWGGCALRFNPPPSTYERRRLWITFWRRFWGVFLGGFLEPVGPGGGARGDFSADGVLLVRWASANFDFFRGFFAFFDRFLPVFVPNFALFPSMPCAYLYVNNFFPASLACRLLKGG